VPQSAPKGTLGGVLHWFGSGAPVASNFVLEHARRFGPHKPVEPDADASDPGGDGLFAIDGDKLVTAAAMLPVGFYARWRMLAVFWKPARSLVAVRASAAAVSAGLSVEVVPAPQPAPPAA
jgi:hypothetical protein